LRCWMHACQAASSTRSRMLRLFCEPHVHAYRKHAMQDGRGLTCMAMLAIMLRR
jgi:hypothetical protein